MNVPKRAPREPIGPFDGPGPMWVQVVVGVCVVAIACVVVASVAIKIFT